MKQYFTLISLLICFTTFAQTEENPDLFISGKVFSADSLHPLPNTHIVINQEKLGLSKADGSFMVLAKFGDTLNFSHMGFKHVKHVITDSLATGEYIMGVYLPTDTLQISEVLVRPRHQNLESLMSDKNHDKKMANATNNLKTATYIALTTAPKEMDADMHFKRFKQSFMIDAENKGLIPADQMVGMNFLAIIPYLYSLYKNVNEEPKFEAYKIRRDEEDWLKLMFKELHPRRVIPETKEKKSVMIQE